MNRTLVIAIGIILALCLGWHFYAEWNMAQFDASLPQPPEPEPQQVANTEVSEQETEAAGHWHGDEWHAEPHEAPIGTSSEIAPGIYSDFSNFSEEKLREMAAQYWRQLGVPPPPEGYTYIWDDDLQHELGITARRDANGEPILHPEGDPIFDVRLEPGFRPTPEQFAHYEEIRIEANRLASSDPRLPHLLAQLRQMEREYIGDIPVIYSTNYFPSDWTEEQKRDRDRRTTEEGARLKYAEYRKMGLDYLIPDEYR